MSVKCYSLFRWFLLIFPLTCSGAPPSSSRAIEEIHTALRQMRLSLSDLKNEVYNHDAEIRTFEAKFQNQEITLDSLRQEWEEQMQTQQQGLRTSALNLESKIASVDQLVTGLVADMRQLRTHANDSVEALKQYKYKIEELEKIATAQNQYIRNLESDIKTLESALQAIVEAMQVKEAADKAAVKASKRLHTVQAGETLEKIARQYHVSVQALREANQLDKDRNPDRIFVGQTLKIP